MTEIRWEDPPTVTRTSKNRRRFEQLASALKRNPGKWARVAEYKGTQTARTTATSLRKAFPDFEIVGKTVDDGSAIFARYPRTSDDDRA